MSIIPKLATSLNRRDEVPNQQLAAEIAKSGDAAAVQELAQNLFNGNKGIRYDCIKVLYEIGYADPKLIAGDLDTFLELLTSSDNRMQWGAMTALACIAKVNPARISAALPEIVDAADQGSVITRDQCVNVLVELMKVPVFADEAFAQLQRQLATAPTNQLPMYAERAAPSIDPVHRDRLIEILSSRLYDIDRETGRKRIEKVIAKLRKASGH